MFRLTWVIFRLELYLFAMSLCQFWDPRHLHVFYIDVIYCIIIGGCNKRCNLHYVLLYISKEACVVAISNIAYNPPTQPKSVIVRKIYDRIICPGEHLCHNSRSLLSIDCHFHSVTASNMLAHIQWSVHYMNSFSCNIDWSSFHCQSYRVYLCKGKLVL